MAAPATLQVFSSLCNRNELKYPIAMITAYNALTSQLASQSGADIILVGDSVATVCLGYAHTKELRFEEFQYAILSVLRKSGTTPVIADITYDLMESESKLMTSSQYLIQQGCSAVKIEYAPNAIQMTKTLTANGVQVVGHVGITPQTVATGQSMKVVGKNLSESSELLAAAKAFESSGCCMLVVECVIADLLPELRQAVRIPIIGIGSGIDCDGQVLVFHDIIGWNNHFKAKFSKSFTSSQEEIEQALTKYVSAVHSRSFPTDAHTYHRTKI